MRGEILGVERRRRRKRWSEKGIFARMLLGLADQSGDTDTLTIDATHLIPPHGLQPGAEKGGVAA